MGFDVPEPENEVFRNLCKHFGGYECACMHVFKQEGIFWRIDEVIKLSLFLSLFIFRIFLCLRLCDDENKGYPLTDSY